MDYLDLMDVEVIYGEYPYGNIKKEEKQITSFYEKLFD